MRLLPALFPALLSVGAPLAFLIPVLPEPSSAEPSTSGRPLDPDPRAEFLERIRQAVFADGELFLLTEGNSLSAITEGGNERRSIEVDGPIQQMTRHNGRLVILICATKACSTWKLQERDGAEWVTQATIETEGDEFTSLLFDENRIIILTPRRFIVVAGNDQRSVTLVLPTAETPKPSSRSLGTNPAMLINQRRLYVGYDIGEWGGGLQRIDLETGVVTTIEHKAYGLPYCDRPLDTHCDPVTALVPEPWNADCIVASIGLLHLGSSGRIIEVCGDTVRRIYFKPLDDGSASGLDPVTDGEPYSTVAFIDLLVSGSDLIALGANGIYRVKANGAGQSAPFPDYENYGGAFANFDDPDFILVLAYYPEKWGKLGRSLYLGGVTFLVPR